MSPARIRSWTSAIALKDSIDSFTRQAMSEVSSLERTCSGLLDLVNLEIAP